MQNVLQQLVHKKTGKTVNSIKRIGGGFYADVYRADFQSGQTQIIKVYKPKGMMAKEVKQIQLLSKYATVPMPKALWTHTADEGFGQDVLSMNYLDGVNGGGVFYLSRSKREKLAQQVTDILISFHNVHNPNGFGEIDADKYYKTFNEYYKNRAASILEMAKQLNNNGKLSDYVFGVAKAATEQFDKIFYLPITEASLIHGDYNMWNIMVDKNNYTVTAVIDPCGCMWADSEYDLYQLCNANGKHFKLLETYAKKKCLSANCREKMAFYELFSEIEHYYNSGYPVNQKKTKKQADNLRRYLR